MKMFLLEVSNLLLPNCLKSNKITFRFLLSRPRWDLISYEENSHSALQVAVKDLSPDDDNISVYRASNLKLKENHITDFEIIAFLFSASSRLEPSHLFYIDLDMKDIYELGLNIRKNPKTANLQYKFYCQKHYEIYPMTAKSREKIATKIFSILKNKYNGIIPKIEKNKFKLLIKEIFIDSRLKNFPKEQLGEKWRE